MKSFDILKCNEASRVLSIGIIIISLGYAVVLYGHYTRARFSVILERKKNVYAFFVRTPVLLRFGRATSFDSIGK